MDLLQAKSSDLLNNEAFKRAVEEVEEELVREWKNTGVKNSQDRETLYLALRQLADIVRRLERIAAKAENIKSK